MNIHLHNMKTHAYLSPEKQQRSQTIKPVNMQRYMRIDEQQQLEREQNEHKKKIDMSKNLISILFKQDKQEEKRNRDRSSGGQGSSNNGGVGGIVSKGSKAGSILSDNEPLDADSYQYFIKTFQNHGFSFYIEFSDLKFDIKNDFIGGGGYGEVFKA